MNTSKPANKLISSASPYLLQHAYNPVQWQEWNAASLAEAKEYNKPIIVSIGYSACHWCHVMERECFENEAIAEIMNKHFICIKIDREERPDIDAIYMEAVQAMGINGGWPLNVFLMPNLKPFYGGTYFPPTKWTALLENIANAFVEHEHELLQSADEFAAHINRSEIERFRLKEGLESKPKTDSVEKHYAQLSKAFDTTWGGLQRAPKFPLPSIWIWLTQYAHTFKDADALQHLTLTLDKMSMGGLYDCVVGGFSRYSVDGEWFAPHFEKMLYDNGQLLTLYSEAYALTKKSD
ncbi:MAG: thioredoxin domain-containing protein, partial [Flexibacteraceae bacterium]